MAKLAHQKKSVYSGNQRIGTESEAPKRGYVKKPLGNFRFNFRKQHLFVLAGILLVGAAIYGIIHQNRTCTGVEFIGTKASNLTHLRNLTPVKEGTVYADIDMEAVADSVRRYPWVKGVQIDERWNGIFTIHIEERIPVLLVLDKQGYPQYYLDRTGRQMPLSKNATFDLPLVSGNTPRFQNGQWIGESSLRELGWAMSQIDANYQALASSFYIRNSGSILMQTVEYGKKNPIEVKLGLTDFKERLQTFGAFWHQAVLPRPDKTFQQVDLRFDGQIVTRES